MKKQGGGTIVNIISTSALYGRPNASCYSASKFAVSGFTKSIRIEAKPKGITVIGVYPGGMKTDLFVEDRHPEYEKFMEPDYVAGLIVENLKKYSPDEEQIILRPGKA